MTNPNEVTEQDVIRFALAIGATDHQNLIRQALTTFVAHRTSATSDAARLDWLQKRGATVSMVPGKGISDWQFQIGGLYGATDTNIRIAIDAAIAAGGSQNG